MLQDLADIKDWMHTHAPETLIQLNQAASPAEIQMLERELGLPLPESFKQFLAVHDGELGLTCTAFWGDFHMMLSCGEILRQYQLDQQIGRQLYDPEMATHAFWRDRVAGHVIFVSGAVQPLMLHPKWIPLTNMNGDVMRYLDYDPAPGGIAGQIIEVDPESCAYKVIAPSFEALLKQYRQDLYAGKYTVSSEGYIESEYDNDVMSWGMPEWLALG